MANLLLRTVVLYLTVIIAMRIMGKRQIGELQPSEMVVTIIISDLAAIPIQETGTPILWGVIPIFTLIILEVFLSYISLKNKKIRDLITSTPSIIIQNGEINLNEMKKLRMNNDDLMEELRLCNCRSINDIRYAIVETNGKLSLIMKEEEEPLTLKEYKER